MKASLLLTTEMLLPKRCYEMEVTMTKKITGTVEEAAVVAGISRNSGYEGVKKGEIPATRIGRRWIVLWQPFLRILGVED